MQLDSIQSCVQSSEWMCWWLMGNSKNRNTRRRRRRVIFTLQWQHDPIYLEWLLRDLTTFWSAHWPWNSPTDPTDGEGFSCGRAPTRTHYACSTNTLHLPQTTLSETTMNTTDIETLIQCVASVNRQMKLNTWSDSQEIIFIACVKESRKTLVDLCEIVHTGVSIYGNTHPSSFRPSSRVRNSKIFALCSLSAVSVTPIADTDTATHGEQEPDMSMGKPGFTTTFILWNTTTMMMIDTTAVNIPWPETKLCQNATKF